MTGAAGFIGRHLCRHLLAEGWHVRALDLHRAPDIDTKADLEFVQMDVRDENRLGQVLEGADAVFHLASAHLQVRAPEGWYESVNVHAVKALVAACAVAKVGRLIHVSSVGIYGHVENPPADEGSPKRPENEYERTKLEGETLALQEARERGVDLIVLRPGWVYGPGCPRTAKLLRSIRKGRFFYVGEGANLRHPIFIDDAVLAMSRAAEAPSSACGRPYLIVGPRPVTVRELVSTGATVLGVAPPTRRVPRTSILAMAWMVEKSSGALRREPPFSRRSLAFFENDNAFDGQAAVRGLGFRATVDLEEGLRRTVSTQRPKAQEAYA